MFGVYLNTKALVFMLGPFKYNGTHASFDVFARILECYNKLYQPRHCVEYQWIQNSPPCFPMRRQRGYAKFPITTRLFQTAK